MEDTSITDAPGPLGKWWKAARPLAHLNLLPLLVLGQVFAYVELGRFDWKRAVFIHVFGVLDHLYIVFANDVADVDADGLSEGNTPFSGGSRVLVDGWITRSALRRGAIVAACMLLAWSVAAVSVWRLALLPVFALAALLLLWIYSFRPMVLSYRGYGEIVQAIGMGVVLPTLAFYVQAGSLARFRGEVLAPLILMSFAANIFTALPDVEADRRADKMSWPVRRGEFQARRDALVLSALGVLCVSAVTPPLSHVWLGVALSLPALLGVVAIRWLRRGDALARASCLRFVFFGAGMLPALCLSWSAALLWRRLY